MCTRMCACKCLRGACWPVLVLGSCAAGDSACCSLGSHLARSDNRSVSWGLLVHVSAGGWLAAAESGVMWAWRLCRPRVWYEIVGVMCVNLWACLHRPVHSASLLQCRGPTGAMLQSCACPACRPVEHVSRRHASRRSHVLH